MLPVHMTKFNSTESSYRYFRDFWIIKYVDLEPILFCINLDAMVSHLLKFLTFLIMCFYRLYC